ncbi:GlsB/YeaQ/YmgE family stress response membrane protein [Sandaracinus amylolyticus]|uniref:GlsB/YeaQ/YmgE family stress response membrane protein n=1 Tax=Sandaracinus amylolyticus TaxID=927083 RepID=A0A0F6W9D7_9BACT|nr:hypothetical protein [Sandaracinus amylolyticus]AKF10742.1 hypothetical protein DB32_007891 [Sandaracinus amylolyticus]
MAVLILSWIVVAFLFALFAHALLPDDGAIDVDVTLVLGMTGALIGGALANHLVGEPLWGVHAAGFAGGAMGAIGGVATGALGQRRRASQAQRTS